MDYDTVTRYLLGTSLVLGLLSMFAYQIIVFPIGAAVTGLLGVTRNDPGRLTGKWRGWLGLLLGGAYTLLATVRFLGA